MAHQDRRGYYYRTRKSGGRVVTAYLGKGDGALLLAQADELRRMEEAERTEAFLAWKAELDALAARMAEQDQAVNLLVRAALLAGGFRPHHRQWRRSKPVDVLPPDVAEALKGMSFDDVLAVVRRAEKGDRTALPKLRLFLQIPGFMKLLHGDVVQSVRSTFAKRINENNLLQIETTLRQCELMAEELAGKSAPPLERLLCERIATAHLHLHVLEVEYAARGMTLDQAAHLQKCISRAQQRYLAAVRALAMVRKMGAGSLTMQLNVGAVQQINPAAQTPDVLPIENRRQTRPAATAANGPVEPEF